MLLPLLELIIGMLYGVSLSLYAPSIIKNGLAESYGYLALLSTAIAVLTYYLTGELYERGKYFAMILAGIFLAIASRTVEEHLVLATALLTVFAGIHYVTILYIARDTKTLILAHASYYLGMSLGAMLVYFEIKSPALPLLALSSIFYCFLTKEKRERVKRNRSPRLGEIFTVFSIFGLALGLTTMNVEYYIALRFDAEKEVAFLITIASLLSSIATILASPVLGKVDATRFHLVAFSFIALFFTSFAFVDDLNVAIALVALSDFAIIFADSALEGIYALKNERKGLAITIIGISWEIFVGIGKIIGFLLYSMGHGYPWLLSSAILISYVVLKNDERLWTKLRFWTSKGIFQSFRSTFSS
ncbi:MAG: hypothetical protein ACK401_03255 [Archaeoglobaceae archaeon]